MATAQMTPDLSITYQRFMSCLQYLGRFGQCGVFSPIPVTFDSTSSALFQMSGKESKDDLDDLVNSIENVSVGQEKKKKKKNKKKKEGDEDAADVEERSVVENGALESGLEGAEDPATNKKKKPKKKKGAAVQTDPPTVAVKDLFPSGQFPEGQILEHPIALSDTTAKNR